MRNMRKSGFTLVELLVVIGIIALLISILLPSLNRARGAARSITCLAKLKEMGTLLNIYAASTKGWLPYGYGRTPYNGNWYSQNASEWTWCDTLSLMGGRAKSKQQSSDTSYNWAGKWVGNMADDYLPVFHDTDTFAASYVSRSTDYACHPRIMPASYQGDVFSPGAASGKADVISLRQLASIRRAADIMMIWDTGVRITSGGESSGTTNPVSDGIDQSAITYGYSLAYPPAQSWADPAVESLNRIAIGNATSGTSYSSMSATPPPIDYLRLQNKDYTNLYYNDAASMRFRHINNTVANVLFADGHAESRQLGQVVQRDLAVNPVKWTTVSTQ